MWLQFFVCKLAEDTFQHGVGCELLHRASIGAAFVKLFPHVHKWKETFGKDKILKNEVKETLIQFSSMTT